MADVNDRRPRAVLIAGPTASGKSALALRLAAATGGVVVNADSMQVYRELDILTARPGAADLAAVDHRLYGHVPAAEGYTVARWLADMAAVLADLAAAGRPAIVTGGTGLYFTALTEGLSDVPPVPAEIRARWRALAGTSSPADLHRRLAALDPPLAARLSPADGQRVLRALEVLEATGRSLGDWQRVRSAPLVPPGEAIRLVVAPDRAWLHGRIRARFDAMVAGGGLDEARSFAALDLDPALPAMKAIGVPEMMAAAAGRLPLDAAVTAAVTAPRRYAKRQETWFRNQMPDWRRVDPEAMAEDADLLDDPG